MKGASLAVGGEGEGVSWHSSLAAATERGREGGRRGTGEEAGRREEASQVACGLRVRWSEVSAAAETQVLISVSQHDLGGWRGKQRQAGTRLSLTPLRRHRAKEEKLENYLRLLKGQTWKSCWRKGILVVHPISVAAGRDARQLFAGKNTLASAVPTSKGEEGKKGKEKIGGRNVTRIGRQGEQKEGEESRMEGRRGR